MCSNLAQRNQALRTRQNTLLPGQPRFHLDFVAGDGDPFKVPVVPGASGQATGDIFSGDPAYPAMPRVECVLSGPQFYRQLALP
ncbi:MAG: hypothetical protein OXP66_15295, partial [Candidatus Tectomicrobia bacterium]|nr:hypothetical protein [Candidatus Tectomicrobia bacterium]